LFLAGAAAGALIAANGVLSAVRKRTARSRSRDDGRRVRVGLEVARDDNWKIFRGKKVGVVSNPTGVLPSTLEHAVDVMHASNGAVDIRAVFGPEQGFRGVGQNSNPYGSYDSDKENGSDGVFTDQRTGLPVYDTYLKKGPELTAVLERSGVDVVAFDIQDVGARYYAYVWTLYDVMVAAAAAKRPISVVVLDRPNPLGGEVLEGPVDIEPGCDSLVGRKPLPVRHGMTVGELAWFLNKKYVATDPDNRSNKSVKLSVVAMRGYRRRMTWEDTGLPWVPPSANMPTPRTALAYIGGALLEGTNAVRGERDHGAVRDGGRDVGGRATRGCSHATYQAATGVLEAGVSERVPAAGPVRGRTGTGGVQAGRELGEAGAELQAQLRRVLPGEQPEEGRTALARNPARRCEQEIQRRQPHQGERGRKGTHKSRLSRPASKQTLPIREGAPDDGPAAKYREAYFTPSSGALQGRIVSGVQVYPRGIEHALFGEGVRILSALRKTYPNDFAWREQSQPTARTRVENARWRAEHSAVLRSPAKSTYSNYSRKGVGGYGGTYGGRWSDEGDSSEDERGWRGDDGEVPWSPESRGGGRRSSFPPRSPLPPASPAPVAWIPMKTPFIDMLTGGSALREAVDAGDDEKVESVLAEWECQLERFADIRRGFLLYD
jgi:uncharacterized protein YbbC (DUF1343 family)